MFNVKKAEIEQNVSFHVCRNENSVYSIWLSDFPPIEWTTKQGTESGASPTIITTNMTAISSNTK